MRKLVLIPLAGALLASAQTTAEKLAPYFPTPTAIVEKMLTLGGLKAGEKMFDLGSGDGRIVIMAAQKFKAEAVGVEFDSALVKQSLVKIHKLGLAEHAHIIEGDMMAQDYSSADLVTVYLLTDSNVKLRQVLEKQLRKGTRVVAHDFEIGGWTPVKTADIDNDGEGRSHRLYLYVR